VFSGPDRSEGRVGGARFNRITAPGRAGLPEDAGGRRPAAGTEFGRAGAGPVKRQGPGGRAGGALSDAP